jgi:4-amino-4-deoxy-L-arabinose transferase-like glycosyltransferase
MDSQISAWGRSNRNEKQETHHQHWFWFYLLLGAAIILFTFNLGHLPIQASYEGKIAQTAKEIWQGSASSLDWNAPGRFELQHFPLMELITAFAYQWGGVTPLMTRLPGTLLASLSVPLIYSLGREIFTIPRKAIFASFIYLTLLPVLSYSRLATLDGAVLFLIVALMWCMARSRRDLRYCLGAGLSLGTLCLLKGLGGVVWLGIILAFLAWDTPRLLSCGYFWGGIFLGCAPMLGWYGAQWHYHLQSLSLPQALNQFFVTLSRNIGQSHRTRGSWFYLLEIWRYGLPWLVFLPAGLLFAWRRHNWSWAKLVLVWLGIYLGAGLLIPSTSWSLLPLYPVAALAIASYFSDGIQLPQNQAYPRFWTSLLALLTVVAIGSTAYVGIFRIGGNLLFLTMAALALTMLTAAVLVSRRDWQFLLILFWGSYVTLFLFLATPYWGLDFRNINNYKPRETKQTMQPIIPTDFSSILTTGKPPEIAKFT